MAETTTSPFFLSPPPNHTMAPARTHHVQSPGRPAQTPLGKGQSPSYFSFTADSNCLNESPRHAKSNWSPPSSAVRSTAAAYPSLVPLDQNPEYDAFRKHTQTKAFNLGGLTSFNMSMPPPKSSPSSNRRTSVAQDAPRSRTESRDIPSSSHRAYLDPNASEVSRSPKRVLSPGAAAESHRRGSPASFVKHDIDRSAQTASSPPERDSRFHLPLDSVHGARVTRAETLPAGDGPVSGDMVPPQHIINLIDSRDEEILLLDLRVSTQYAAVHITGALNLCIPTTLLKRPSFNVQKLAETFKDSEQRNRFENWRNSSYIIVYDSHSAQMKDAAICVNTVKKFRSEGYEGTLYIVQGGYTGFARAFPAYVENGLQPTMSQSSSPDARPKIAPVIGGCPMPSTDKPANPFFGNIRQNMDLIGGVGQIPIKHPSKATAAEESHFPSWLQHASQEPDQGKRVSIKFEQIERREKKRMEDALSGNVSWGTPKQEMGGAVQIAGLEKGNKNRYNNIWPFEHSRVKLQGVPSHGCDYFNGSYIQASRSNKRYISTQAPIPATFNDFWSIVWQQDIRVIVMLTAEKEGAQVKAHNYWEEKAYGPFRLDFLAEKRASLDTARIHRHQHRPGLGLKRTSTALSTSQIPLAQLDSRDDNKDQPYVVVRKFTLSHSKLPFEPMREITQLQYSSWPDFGAPTHPAHLLGLVEQCDAVARAVNKTHSREPEPANRRPILVHCSAGCGRTGTFCTVDSVIDMLKRQKQDREQTKQRKGAKDDSSMDVDAPTSQSNGDFFSSQAPRHSDAGGVERGAWVKADDQDLIERTVEDFRMQRISMVQSLRQYVLCYETVMEWLMGEEHKGS